MSYITDDLAQEDIFSTPTDTTDLLPTAKEIAIEKCGQWRHYWNVKTQSTKSYQRFCNYYNDCEICKKRKKKLNADRLNKLYGKAVAMMTVEQFKEFKQDRTQDQYLRIPMSDGAIAIVLEKRNDWNGEVQWLKNDLIDTLSTESVPAKGKGRVSGKLDQVKEPDDPWKEFEPHMLIAYREFEVEWNDKLKDVYQLEAIVLDRFDRHHGMERNLDNLQTIIFTLENITEQVIKECDCEGFHFLQTTLINVWYSDVEWNLWPNAPD